jgi:hypothetical protein
MARAVQLRRNRVRIHAALLVTVSVALTLLGCRDAAVPPSAKTVVDVDPLDQARRAMARHEYDAAVALLHAAVAKRPDDFEAHYRLGVSASHLDRVDEARREFEWVVAHGVPGAPEIKIAQNWLAARPAPHVPAPATVAVSGEAVVRKPDLAILTGRALGPEGAKARLQLFLKGVPGTPVQDEYHIMRTDAQGNFRFTDVVPGDYMLTNAIAGPPMWRLRVTLAKGERLALDLRPSNQAAIRDDFRDQRP